MLTFAAVKSFFAYGLHRQNKPTSDDNTSVDIVPEDDQTEIWSKWRGAVHGNNNVATVAKATSLAAIKTNVKIQRVMSQSIRTLDPDGSKLRELESGLLSRLRGI